MLRRLIAIVGPTASGKSALALQLAREVGGEIVNSDSRQIYRGMDIGTAKPSAEERRLVHHHLFDIADPADAYSLALYRRDARVVFESIWERGNFAWLVGGTGQYLWAMLENWQVPEVPPDDGFRAELSEFVAVHGASALHARLATVDPVSAERLDARNVRRVVRALEVFEHTGVPMSTWQTKGKPDFEFLLFGVDVPRDELVERIGGRVDEMFAQGFVEEVQHLLDSGVAPNAPAMSSIGYSQVIQYLAGEITLVVAIEGTKKATRRLARSQMQWFRRDDPRITWVHDAEDIEMQANIFTGACTNTIWGQGRA